MGDAKPSTKTKEGDYWWKTANLGECPITLECFSTLEYPPFALYHDGKTDDCNDCDGVSTYFDGLALASYIVSRGVFQNPLTRVELTAEDCRRLDRYLEDHCYSSNADTSTKIFRGSRAISVAEAFALRNSVSVETTSTRSDRGLSNTNNERDRERIQILQNTATAALAGLFIYGNDRNIHQTDEVTSRVPQLRNETSSLSSDWGFDLSRRVEDSSAAGTHGYRVVDDDEAVVVASQQLAYETLQEAFPPLTDCETNDVSPVSTDERLMNRIRTLAIRDTHEQKMHSIELEKAREQLLREALERRKQRQKDRADRLARGAQNYKSQKKDEGELERVRIEIEAWRDDQWEKLRLLSEREQLKKKEKDKNSVSHTHSIEKEAVLCKEGSETNTGGVETDISDETRAATAVAKKKAKAAAKRKRAKERSKAKKALEKEEVERLRLKQAKEAQRAASDMKCGACGTGILKLSNAFERFDQLFCSPKCARTAVKVV